MTVTVRFRLELPSLQPVKPWLIAIGLGVIGFFMRRTGYPVAPLVLGFVLGPMLETQFRRALSFSEGSPAVFFTRPISAAILTLTFIALIGPILWRYRTKKLTRA